MNKEKGHENDTDDRIVPARETDYEVVRGINGLLRLADVPGFYWDTEAYIRAAIRQGRCLVCKGPGGIKGVMILEERATGSGAEAPCLAVGSLAVRPAYRGNGVGAALVQSAIQLARGRGVLLLAESFYPYRKVSFYQALGFRRTGEKTFHGVPYHVFALEPG